MFARRRLGCAVGNKDNFFDERLEPIENCRLRLPRRRPENVFRRTVIPMYDTFSALLGNGLQSHDFERFTAGKTPTEKRQRAKLAVFFLLPFCDKAFVNIAVTIA